MIHAYDKLYLDSAQENMGVMLDAAVNELHMKLEEFYDRFLKSLVSVHFSRGDAATIAGRSGVELMYDVLEEDTQHINLPYTKSPEYWTGWALAYYQWYCGMSFQILNEEVPIQVIIDMYHPYHEMDLDHFVERMDALRRQKRLTSYLKLYRQKVGLTQRELAEKSEIPLKTIQQYEQRQKDINKAQIESVLRMAQVLGCEPEQLLER